MDDKQTNRFPLQTELTVIPPADEPQANSITEATLINADETDESKTLKHVQ
jgi:hypothetical protein